MPGRPRANAPAALPQLLRLLRWQCGMRRAAQAPHRLPLYAVRIGNSSACCSPMPSSAPRVVPFARSHPSLPSSSWMASAVKLCVEPGTAAGTMSMCACSRMGDASSPPPDPGRLMMTLPAPSTVLVRLWAAAKSSRCARTLQAEAHACAWVKWQHVSRCVASVYYGSVRSWPWHQREGR